ncbi:MAG: hypothetical protein FWE21_00860 [Defluviitaleaceae bacterium]|nr:hypothetical protein [Defluviitaleaceae bacterium]
MLDFGSRLALHKNKASSVIWLRVLAVVLFVGLGVGGVYFLLNPIDAEDTIMGFVALGMAVTLPAVLWFVTARMQAEVAIHQQGVMVKAKGKEHSLHFSQIRGLQDVPGSGGVFIVPGGFGIAGAIVAGVASAVASGAADAHRRNNRLRSINIIPAGSGAAISVVNTAGDHLSEIYTAWLIKEKGITKANLPNLTIPFGDELVLERGTLVHKHRKGDIRLPIGDVTNINTDDGTMSFFAINEKGRDGAAINISIQNVINVDLLFGVFDIIGKQQ